MSKSKIIHKFVDEVGDPVFYNSKKNRQFKVGDKGVSKSFGIGMLELNEPLAPIRSKIISLQQSVENSLFFNLNPRSAKRIKNYPFYFHCSEDTIDIRKMFFNFIQRIDCRFKIVIARKIR